MGNKYSVSILGSCVSRDIFNSEFVSTYKDYFVVCSYAHQPSIISVMSEPIPYLEKRLVGKSPSKLDKNQLADELTKQFLVTLQINQPNILLVDFYGDAMYGVVEVGNSYILGKDFRFSKYDVYNDLDVKQKYYPRENVEPFFSMWKKSFDSFMHFINEKLPMTKVIINCAKANNYYLNNLGEKVVWNSKKEVEPINHIWNMMDDYATSKYNLAALRYSEEDLLLDLNHKWGAFLVHYTKDYYKKCFSQLLKVVPDETHNAIVKYDDNVILNSNCEYGNKFWTYWDDCFIIKENEAGIKSIEISEDGNTSRVRRYCWSAAAEINGDGKTEYCLSMDVFFHDIDDDGKFFCVRTFNKRDFIKYSDSIKSYDFYYRKYNMRENCNNYFEYRFKPKGKYIKVAPFINKNGYIRYSNIRLTKI